MYKVLLHTTKLRFEARPHLSLPVALSEINLSQNDFSLSDASLLSFGHPRFLTTCTFSLLFKSVCSPGAQLPTKNTEILSQSQVTLQCSPCSLYRVAKFPTYLQPPRAWSRRSSGQPTFDLASSPYVWCILLIVSHIFSTEAWQRLAC